MTALYGHPHPKNRRHGPYHLLLDQSTIHHRTLNPLEPNIFRNGEVAEDVAVDDESEGKRPIGGMELFKRMVQRERGSLRKSNKGYRGTFVTQDCMRTRKRDRARTELRESSQIDKSYNTLGNIDPHFQTFKEHKIYVKKKPPCNKSQSRLPVAALAVATETQRKSYIDKSALLNEIDRVRPLVQHCGDRYFEMMLRERWREELKLPQFIYQLRQGEDFTHNKTISRIKELKPQIRERRGILLRGRKVVQG